MGINTFNLILATPILIGLYPLGTFIIILLIQALRSNVNQQIENQLKSIIPFKVIREKIGVKIKWK